MRFLSIFLINISVCLGLQNFMGANIHMICVPTQVKLDESFAIQVKYKTDIPREVDVHFDVIDKSTKEWITGMMVKS